jgi:hypothetical protein
MSFNFQIKLLAGAVALAISGTAMANTSLDAIGTGDLFVNIVDASNNTSFLFDTGVSQASFNGNLTQSFTFAGDANYAAFLAGAGSDALNYSILSGTKASAATMLFTSASIVLPIGSSTVFQAETFTNGFLSNANLVTSATTNSALLGPANTWGQSAYELSVTSALGVSDNAALGTAMAFYNEIGTNPRSGAAATLTQYTGTWDVLNGIATYTTGSQAVPLPTPILLLLSGLGLMGVVARRGKDAAAV